MKKMSKTLKIILLAVTAVAVIITGALLLSPDANEEESHDYFIAVQDKKMLLMDAVNFDETPSVIDTLKGEEEVPDFSPCINSSNDFIVYANNYSCNEYGEPIYDLYLYHIESGTSSLVAESVCGVSVSEDFRTFTYFKSDEGIIYRNTLDNSGEVILQEDVISFYISDDAQTIVFENTDKETFVKTYDDEPQLVGEYITMVDFDPETGDFLYLEESNLIKYSGGDLQILTEDYGNIISHNFNVGCNGGYFTEECDEISIAECFSDDMGDSISESEKEDFYDRLNDIFFMHSGKIDLFNLCYYDGTEVICITEKVYFFNDGYCNNVQDNSLIVPVCVQFDDTFHLKLSDVYEKDDEEIFEAFFDVLDDYYITKIFKNGELIKTFDERVQLYLYLPETEPIYVTISNELRDDESSYADCSIYKAILKDNVYTEFELIKREEFLSVDFFNFVGNQLLYAVCGEYGDDFYTEDGLLLKNVTDYEFVGDECIQFEQYMNDNAVFYIDGEVCEDETISCESSAYLTEHSNLLVLSNYEKKLSVLGSKCNEHSDVQYDEILILKRINNKGSFYATYNDEYHQDSDFENFYEETDDMLEESMPEEVTEPENEADDKTGSKYSDDNKTLLKVSENIETYTVPAYVEKIAEDAFSKNNILSEISVDRNNKFFEVDEYGVLYSEDKTELIFCPANNENVVEYIIPDSVKKVRAYAFKNSTYLEKVSIPDTVTEIGEGAFFHCFSLREVNLPSNMTRLPENIFASCLSLEHVDLPVKITEIGANAFNDCEQLRDLSFPKSLEVIGDSAFECCWNLSKLDFPDSLTAIGKSAFEGDYTIGIVKIPASLNTIGTNAFKHCSGISMFTVDEKNAAFSEIDGALYNKNKTKLIMVNHGVARTTFTVPDGVEVIGSSAFGQYFGVETVVLPDSVRIIENAAFGTCRDLRKVVLGNKIERIEDAAFFACQAMESINIPCTVKHIGEDTWTDCCELTITYDGTKEEFEAVNKSTLDSATKVIYKK